MHISVWNKNLGKLEQRSNVSALDMNIEKNTENGKRERGKTAEEERDRKPES